MKGTDGYDPEKHGDSLGLYRKAIEAQLVLLRVDQLKCVMGLITEMVTERPPEVNPCMPIAHDKNDKSIF